ncbi:Imidazoleglycerol-phosphate dehydratase [Spirochaeta thermophila DSM 6578]|uniref:Imidazoleglycerol-phosphate dehydratase n=1 Tax=Winmispira thermophila (strain ATCC 700085 / DSM 6578 / Z-1203) TaxID=869211 RepID=G0GFT8_WINT7|nr:imidazoleglycerol-phosphate dehydratase HisB [Spirochaeta thermophila]AEJ61631.1 Imidazoleglycerol-phosphate dehydratase [Spirochaeta thermophila DSM 6578]
MENPIHIERITKETRITLSLHPGNPDRISLNTPLPFFTHLLHAASFHGGFGLELEAQGDIEVDPHHLVEDTGIVLGTAFREHLQRVEAVRRYGYAIIPMDDALCQAVVDVCERPYLVYRVTFPQAQAGNFPLFLLKEFFLGFVNNARINLHLEAFYGENGHHIAEALFKAWGKALEEAYTPRGTSRSRMSTKGTI